MGVAVNGNPGSGGVSRGRADAELTWTKDPVAGDTSQFEAKSLKPAELLDLESSAVLGVGAASPPVEARPEGAGLIEVQASSGKTAWQRRLAPHHREAVQDFFKTPSGKQ